MTTDAIASSRIVTLSRKVLDDSIAEFDANADDYGQKPGATSPQKTEQTAINRGSDDRAKARRFLWRAGNSVAGYTAAGARDYILSTITLLEGSRIPLYAASLLSRAACEAAALANYLMEPELSIERRLLRYGVTILNDHKDRARAAKEFPAGSAMGRAGFLASLESDCDHFAQRLRDCGFTVTKDVVESKAGDRETIRPALTDMAKRLLPNRPAYYNSLSSISHSRPWALAGAMVGEAEDGTPAIAPNRFELGAAALLELDAITALDRLWAVRCGRDPEPAAKKYRQRTKALDNVILDLWQASSGG